MAYAFNDDKSKLALPLPVENGGTGGTSVAAARVGLGIQSGRVAAADIAASTYRDVRVTFGTPYATAPNVVPGLNSSSTAWQSGRISVTALNITTAGFTMRIYNADTVTRAPAASWIAVGGM